MKSWYRSKAELILSLCALSLVAAACKVSDLQTKSGLSSEGDELAIRIMLNDSDLRYIDNKTMEAALICEGVSERMVSRLPARGIGALRGVSFRVDSGFEPGSLCHVEILGSLQEQYVDSIRLEWLTHSRETNLLFISRQAPIVANNNNSNGLGRASISSIFYKTFEAVAIEEDVELDVSDLITENNEVEEELEI